MSGGSRAAAGAARGSDEWIERVRAASDIVEVVGQTVTLKRQGRNWVGLCPFHAEKTPSFAVHPERQFYHCFSCKAGGDVFKFVQESEKLGFVEAAELLSRRAGIPVPERRTGERSTRTPLLEALEAAASSFEQWLADPRQGERAMRYLAERGLSREVMRDFRLGLSPPGWENLVQRLRPRFGEDVLVAAGLAGRRDGGRRGIYDRFRNRLMIPLIAPGGQVIGFGARALESGDSPKYLNSPESAVYHKGSFLYAYEQARRHLGGEDELIVVEGYFDTIALHQAGIRNVVATSGTALTSEQAKLLKRGASQVALTYDGDAAGQDAMMRSLGTLMAEGLEVEVVDLPAGHDPDTLIRQGGAESWRAARAEASDPVMFVQRHGLAEGAGETPALQALVRLAAAVPDPIRRRRMLERGEQVFRLDARVLERAVQLALGGQKTEAPIQAAVVERARGGSHLERELLKALLMAPDTLDAVRASIGPQDFSDPEAAALAGWMWTESEEEPAGEAATLRRELLASAEEDWDWSAVAEANARRLVRRRLERRFQTVKQRFDQLERQGRQDDPEWRRLLEETQSLQRGIRELN